MALAGERGALTTPGQSYNTQKEGNTGISAHPEPFNLRERWQRGVVPRNIHLIRRCWRVTSTLDSTPNRTNTNPVDGCDLTRFRPLSTRSS